MTGMRQGELLAARCVDIDWTARRVRVADNFTRGQFGTPKADQGRSIPMADRLAAELDRHFQRSRFQADGDLVFCHPDTGKVLDPSKLRKRFAATLRRAKVHNTPKVMSEGNWRLGVIIDAAATDEQAEKLGAVFGGQPGGPMEALAPLVGESLGLERAPIEVREEGLHHSVKIGDSVDFEIEDVVPFGVETGEPARIAGIFHPVGSELTVSKATRSSINAFGIEYEARAGFSASSFSWAA